MDQGSALEKANAPAGSGLDRPYQPQEIETRWYEHWIARGEHRPVEDQVMAVLLLCDVVGLRAVGAERRAGGWCKRHQGGEQGE